MNVGNGGGISIEIGGSGQYDITANTTVTFANCDMQNNTASVEGSCIAGARRAHAHVVIVQYDGALLWYLQTTEEQGELSH